MVPPAVLAATMTTPLITAHTRNISSAKVMDAPLFERHFIINRFIAFVAS